MGHNSVDGYKDVVVEAAASYVKGNGKRAALRKGFTTGTSAAAATKAALIGLLFGNETTSVEVRLPKGGKIPIKIKSTSVGDGSVTCAVIKDGGDDPDVTHGAEILSTVSLDNNVGSIRVDGGKGVGRVTKPGLGLPIGAPAINSVPSNMIKTAVLEIAAETLKTKGITVIISVPLGEAIARKTDNPRLGILGGISILGTTGIVIPYSTASFAASIRQSLDVAKAMGADTVALTTGGRSEEFVKKLYSNALQDHSLIQMGDFVGYAVTQCQVKKVKNVIIAGFIGKLSKMAKGIQQTHVKGSHVDMRFLANLASESGCSSNVVNQILKANTARHVQEIVNEYHISGYFDLICKNVYERLTKKREASMNLQIVMFDFEGKVCGQYPVGTHK